MSSRLEAIAAKQAFVILDGGLATELERAGHDLSKGRLWCVLKPLDFVSAIGVP